MNENPVKTRPKVYCAVCDCMVVGSGHDLRCRPRSADSSVLRGWKVERQLAWLGDSIHRMDVQLAVQLRGELPGSWEIIAQTYVSNAAQAQYLVDVGGCDLLIAGRSEHSAGTVFESLYCGEFRVRYLQSVFPDVCERVLGAWRPPGMHECVASR